MVFMSEKGFASDILVKLMALFGSEIGILIYIDYLKLK